MCNQPLREHDLRLIAIRQRHRSEAITRTRFVGNAANFFGVETHRLFHQEWVTVIKQIMRRRRHVGRPPQRKNEVGFGFGQHAPVVGVNRWRRIAYRRCALGGSGLVVVLQRHYIYAMHLLQ